MINETKKNIEAYKAMLPGLKERVAAVALMLVMSIVMMTSASYAWLTISRAPEVTGMSTTISGNGNLEIALAGNNKDSNGNVLPPNESAIGDSAAATGDLLASNITWGNLINLSDSRYGLDQIALRPALLSGYNRLSKPLFGASYSEDGRVESTNQTYGFASWKKANDGTWYFDAGEPQYGVRAISSITYKDITGNATINNMWSEITDAYTTAWDQYVLLIRNEVLVSSETSMTQVYSMDALSMLMEIYVQDRADLMLKGSSSGDYSSTVTYTYRLLKAFQDVLKAEGEALRYLANLQVYMDSNANGSEYYGTITDLVNAQNNGTLHDAVNLGSLATFASDYQGVAKSIEELEDLAEACDPDKVTNPNPVKWSQIETPVERLVTIGTAKIEGMTVGTLSSDDLGGLAGILITNNENEKANVVIYDGILRNTEARIGTGLADNQTSISIFMDVEVKNVPIKKNVYAYVTTDVSPTATTLFNMDRAYTYTLDNNTAGGDPVANDTYGMALDLWVRTNATDTVLTLEGSLKWADQDATTVNKDGETTLLYSMSHEDTTTDVYLLDGSYYDAYSHVELGTEADLKAAGASFTKQVVQVVVGYDGINRIWEDYLSMVDLSMPENNTTQGAGSCYVFYASPSDQSRILKLLEAFTVVFMDENGDTLGTAKLDTEHYYSINGKTTVPLQMITGKTYTDDKGDEHVGITQLVKDEATWITAIIYLDGLRLTNEDVLAVGEIEGVLNIQFGSSVSLINLDDETLRNQYRDIYASAAAGGKTSEKSAAPIEFDYDKNGREVTVTLTVDGEAPSKISAFFIRSISQSQGTRGETVEFKPVEGTENVWAATFKLTNPGTYSLRNLIVDGSDYELEDGTGENASDDNFPTIIIKGLAIDSVVCSLPTGITMTAESYVETTVLANISADANLAPRQIRALFRTEDGREFASFLTYDSITKRWSGTARITESGTYTLQYLVIDGEYHELDADMQTKHIIKLGLVAQVWTDLNPDTFEFTGAVNAPMKLKIFDASYNPIEGLEGVALFYNLDGSDVGAYGLHSAMEWNPATGYYEGQFQIPSAGIFKFNCVTVTDENGTSTIRKATMAPTFTAISPEPPQYVGNATTDYQFVPNSSATMSVDLMYADAATVWAVISDGTNSYLVSSTREPQDDGSYRFTFQVPKNTSGIYAGKQDGEWEITALCLQNVYANDRMYVVTETAPTLTDYTTKCHVITPTDTAQTYVVQTVNVTYTDSTGTKYTGEVFGKDSAGNVIGTFMESYISKKVTISVTDWNGQAVRGITAASATITYGNNPLDYGGYTGGAVQEKTIELTNTGEAGKYTLPEQTYQNAGTYTISVSISVGENTHTENNCISYEVHSVVPTVEISGITGTNSSNTHTSTSATVYTKSSKKGVITKYTIYDEAATVIIKLTNSGYASGATMTFYKNSTATTLLYTDWDTSTDYLMQTEGSTSDYAWGGSNVAQNGCDGETSRYVGYVGSGYYLVASNKNGKATCAGTITANKLVLTYNGVPYTFTVTTLTINNPS